LIAVSRSDLDVRADLEHAVGRDLEVASRRVEFL
jgi:hypothetical protein